MAQQQQVVGGVADPERSIYARPPPCVGDFRAFCRSFRIYLRLQRITNALDQKCSLFLAASTAKNSIKIQALYGDMENVLISYEQFETRLISLFCPLSQSLMARREFLSLKQGAEEDFISYWGAKLSLYLLAFPEDNQSPEQSRFFVEEVIKSLANVEVKRALIRKMHTLTPVNIREEITNCIQSEETLCTFGLSETGTRDGLCYSEQMRNHAARYDEPMDISEVKPGKCNRCNKPGHWARECRMEGNQRTNSKQNGNNQGKFGKKETRETRSCNRCHTPGHLRMQCKIPENKLEMTKKRNKESKAKSGNQSTRGVRQIEVKEPGEETDEAALIEALSLNTMDPVFRMVQ